MIRREGYLPLMPLPLVRRLTCTPREGLIATTDDGRYVWSCIGKQWVRVS